MWHLGGQLGTAGCCGECSGLLDTWTLPGWRIEHPRVVFPALD